MKVILIITVFSIALCSCENNEKKKSDTNKSIEKKDSTIEGTETDVMPEGLSVRYLGSYTGTQESYFLRNANGDEITVRGEKVEVPACEYKFVVKLNNQITLIQVNLSNRQRIIYDGTYQVVDENDHSISISCSVSDGSGSSPNYTLQIDKLTKSAVCFSNSEPEFTLEYGSEKKEMNTSYPDKASGEDSSTLQKPIDPTQDSASF